tara:strand:+ start:45 stop:476 length:432 start_codon:yes stop_codon:yes gene_type:complete
MKYCNDTGLYYEYYVKGYDYYIYKNKDETYSQGYSTPETLWTAYEVCGEEGTLEQSLSVFKKYKKGKGQWASPWDVIVLEQIWYEDEDGEEEADVETIEEEVCDMADDKWKEIYERGFDEKTGKAKKKIKKINRASWLARQNK